MDKTRELLVNLCGLAVEADIRAGDDEVTDEEHEELMALSDAAMRAFTERTGHLPPVDVQTLCQDATVLAMSRVAGVPAE